MRPVYWTNLQQRAIRRPAVLALLACVALAAGFAPVRSEPAPQTGASFFDDFKSFDQKRWFASNGWASGDFQSCTYMAANVRIAGGSMELTLVDRPAGGKPFACAEVQTFEAFSYGTYEVKMRSVAGSGTVSAFFAYAAPNPQDEIDFELLGKNPNAIQLNYFAEGDGKHESIVKLAADGTTTAVRYAFEWLPEKIRWFIDGKVVREETSVAGKPFPKRPMKIFFSIWSGGPGTEQWLGNFSYPGQPLVATFDYAAYTAAGDACQFPDSVVCSEKPKTP